MLFLVTCLYTSSIVITIMIIIFEWLIIKAIKVNNILAVSFSLKLCNDNEEVELIGNYQLTYIQGGLKCNLKSKS